MNHTEASNKVLTALVASTGDQFTAAELQEMFDLELLVHGACTTDADGGYELTADAAQLERIAARSLKRGPSSDVECPPWCASTPGHEYEPPHMSDELFRIHGRTFGADGRVSVEISQGENTLSTNGPANYEPAQAHIAFAGSILNADFNAGECRELSALLLTAADLLESIERATIG